MNPEIQAVLDGESEGCIVCGDCLEVMKDMPDKCVDLVLTDPPYGVGVEYACFDDTKDNVIRLVRSAFPSWTRIATCIALTPGNGNQQLYDPPDWTLAWFYTGGANYCRWGFNCWQPIMVWGIDPKLSRGLGCWPDAFVLNETPEKNGHPCPKPLRVIEWMVNRTSNNNSIILDPFCGSGTTCVAAKKLGRRYIGIDISEQYCEIARQRLLAVETGVPVKERNAGQGGLFDEKTSP